MSWSRGRKISPIHPRRPGQPSDHRTILAVKVGNGSNHETQPLSDEVRNLAGDLRQVDPLMLLVYHRHGIEAVPLERDQSIVVGREEPSDCVVDDATLSRQHARFTRRGAVVEVEDLGSRNGTLVGGRSITQASLAIGSECLLGGVVVALHARAVAKPEGSKSGARRRPPPPATTEPFVESGAMREILTQLERAANSKIPVLLQGETGTGKEVIARAMHDRSERRTGRLISLNCAAIPVHLVETTLFGNERGAFTGADTARSGAFEDAHEGTLLLDEIGELPLVAQAALLRVIETNRVARVGSTREIHVDVRIVAATNRDLEVMVANGTFRADLLYRLNAISLVVPALRERREEIRPLARYFFRRANEVHGLHLRRLDESVLRLLDVYAWPGNVRELRNAIERAVVIAEADEVRVQDLPERIQSASTPPPPEEDATNSLSAKEIKARMQGYESKLIEDALRAAGGNQTEAARRLDMPLRTFVRKVKLLGLRERGDE